MATAAPKPASRLNTGVAPGFGMTFSIAVPPRALVAQLYIDSVRHILEELPLPAETQQTASTWEQLGDMIKREQPPHSLQFTMARMFYHLAQEATLSPVHGGTGLLEAASDVVLPQDLSDRMDHIARLQPGWDDDESVPPTWWAMQVAHNIIRQLDRQFPKALEDMSIVPSPDGGVRLEFIASEGRELNLIIPSNVLYPFECYRYRPTPQLEIYEESFNIAEAQERVRWLYEG